MGMKGKAQKGGRGWKGNQSWQKGKAKTPTPEPKTATTWSGNWGNQDWNAEEATAATGPRRVIGRNFFAKGLLRPYADESLQFIYAEDPETFFDKSSLRTYLSTENSELDRRPAFGWSMLCGSLRSLIQAAESTENLMDKLQELKGLVHKEKKLIEALAACDWEQSKSKKKDLGKNAVVVLNFLKNHGKALHGILPSVMRHSAMLYGGAGQTLDGVVHAGALGRWQAVVPSWPEGERALRKWKKEKATMGNTAIFLQQAYVARGQTEASWKQAQTWHGDESSSTAEACEGEKRNPWGRYGSDNSDSSGPVLGKKRKAKTSSSDEGVTKKKKKQKAVESKKSHKTKKARAKKDASSGSSAVSIAKKKTSKKRKIDAPSTDSADAKMKPSTKKDTEAIFVEEKTDEMCPIADEAGLLATVPAEDRTHR